MLGESADLDVHRWIRDGLVIESDWRVLDLPEVLQVEAWYRRAVNPVDRGRFLGCTYYARPVDSPARARRCRHCGDLIVPTDHGWVHAHHLNRCQQPGRPYGYEAEPSAAGPCTCAACERTGQTSPAANTATGAR
jgi:hypothetical protein